MFPQSNKELNLPDVVKSFPVISEKNVNHVVNLICACANDDNFEESFAKTSSHIIILPNSQYRIKCKTGLKICDPNRAITSSFTFIL